MQLFLGILLLVMSVFLIITILLQSSKSKRLSGTIAGGAETFFGKAKSRTIDAVLSKVTTVMAIIFVLVVIVVYVAFGSSADETIQSQSGGENPITIVTGNNLEENTDDSTVTDDTAVTDDTTAIGDATVTEDTTTTEDATVTDDTTVTDDATADAE